MKRVGLVLVLFLLAGLGTSNVVWSKERFESYLNKVLDERSISFLEENLHAPFALEMVYKANGYALFWSSKKSYQAALQELDNSVQHGLRPDDYHAGKLLQLETMFLDPQEKRFAREILITDGLLLLGQHYSHGKRQFADSSMTEHGNLLSHLILPTKKNRSSKFLNSVNDLVPDNLQYRLLLEYRYQLSKEETVLVNESLIDKIDASLERLRRRNFDFSGNYWQVNIPAFTLNRMKNGRLSWTTKCVVGKIETPTPRLQGRLNQVIINPSWFVPQSIEPELFDLIRKRKDYLKNGRFIVYDKSGNELDPETLLTDSLKIFIRSYDFVQKAGPLNPLGRIKISFPNNQAIFLHDTPNKNAFELDDRALSHGCIRVENIEEFVSQLKVNSKQLTTELDLGITKPFVITSTENLAITYFTASINRQGEIEYYEDVYNLDEKLLSELRKPMINRSQKAIEL